MCAEECLASRSQTPVCRYHRLPGGVSAGNPDPAALVPADSFQRCVPVSSLALRHSRLCATGAAIFGPNAIVLDPHGHGNGTLVCLSIPVGLFRGLAPPGSS